MLLAQKHGTSRTSHAQQTLAYIHRTNALLFAPHLLPPCGSPILRLSLCADTSLLLRLVQLLPQVEACLVVACILAALGAVGRVPRIVAALCYALLNAIREVARVGEASSTAYLLLWTLTAFAAVEGPNDSLSVDELAWTSWLRLRGSARSDQGEHSGTRDGAARKLVLISAIYSLLAGGLAKVRANGLTFLTGEKVCRHIMAQKQFGLWPTAATWLVSGDGAKIRCQVLSAATLLIELGSPLVLFAPRWLMPLCVIAAIGFHIGIGLFMIPKFFTHVRRSPSHVSLLCARNCGPE